MIVQILNSPTGLSTWGYFRPNVGKKTKKSLSEVDILNFFNT